VVLIEMKICAKMRKNFKRLSGLFLKKNTTRLKTKNYSRLFEIQNKIEKG
jgi:hypothetical protein